MQASVNYASRGAELGFRSYSHNTRVDVGLTDEVLVCVTVFRSFPDGAHCTMLDTVDLGGYVSLTVSIQQFVEDDDWEPGDILRIWTEVDGVFRGEDSAICCVAHTAEEL